MPPAADYERLPLHAIDSPPSPRLRTFSNRSRSESPQRVIHTGTSPRQLRRTWLPTRMTRILFLLKYILPLIALLIFVALYLYEPHIEISFYSRNWVKQEIEKVESLGGCFKEENISGDYNVSEFIYGKKRLEVQAGLPLKMGMDCYNFAGTIQSQKNSKSLKGVGVGGGEERIVFHTYWRVDLASFGPRQEWMIKSYFATQSLTSTKLILWSNGDLSENSILQNYLQRYPESFSLEIVDIPKLAKGTELDGSELLRFKDKKAWLDGDLIRLLLLWNYGGVWVDMDSLLTRDLDPLYEHEFITQWDCYDKPYSPFNGALMRFRKHSPYLCETFHIMATSSLPRPGSTDWGSVLYLKLWRRLVSNSIPPFKVLPFCFNDGRSCRLDNRLPDPFKPDRSDGLWTFGLRVDKGGGLDDVLSNKVFGVHLHNQWEKDFPKDGWVERLLLKKYDEVLEKRNVDSVEDTKEEL